MIVLDNDIAMKLSRLLLCNTETMEMGLKNPKFVVLPALQFIAARVILPTMTEARQDFDALIKRAEATEPDEDEKALAIAIEEAAQRGNLDIDPGESIIFAIAICRGCTYVATGDKRAISGLLALEAEVPSIAQLKGKIVTLEAVLLRAIPSVDYDKLRTSICGPDRPDKTLAICFQCSKPTGSIQETQACLDSYQNDLEKKALDYCSRLTNQPN